MNKAPQYPSPRTPKETIAVNVKCLIEPVEAAHSGPHVGHRRRDKFRCHKNARHNATIPYMATSRPETPYHLVPLTEGTPLSLEKVKTAWPALAFCDKIHLLSILLGEPGDETDGGVLKWKRHRNFVRTIALEDANDYVRYFAALSVSDDDKDEESLTVYQRVVKDASSLVVSSQDHWSLSAFMVPSEPQNGVKLFWNVAAPRRLAIAAKLSGSNVAECLKFAVDELLPTGTVTTGELEDVVHEFLGARRPKDVEELWRIVPSFPKGLSLVLVDSLPPLPRVEVPQDLLDHFNDDHIHVLLAREDIQLFELRRKVFRSATKPGLIHAAVSSARLAILDSDVSELFGDPANSADKAVALTQSAKGANLVQKQAVRWLTKQRKLNEFWVEYQSEKHLTARSESLSGKLLEYEILQMRLFELARVLIMISRDGLASGRDEYSGDLDHLQGHVGEYLQHVVVGNPWETFLNLRQAIRDLDSLRSVLPSTDDERYLDRKNIPADLQC